MVTVSLTLDKEEVVSLTTSTYDKQRALKNYLMDKKWKTTT